MPRASRNFAARSCLNPSRRMRRGETLRKRLPASLRSANAWRICCTQRMLSSTATPSSTAAAKSSVGVCSVEPSGPRTSASYPTMWPSRNPKIGWKTVRRLFASSTRRSSAEALRPESTGCRFIAMPVTPRSGHAVSLEPIEHALPSVLGSLLAIARPVVCVERMRHVGIGMDVRRLSGGLQRGAHAIDAIVGDARVGTAVKAQHGRLQVADDVDREPRMQFVRRALDLAVPRHCRLERAAVGRIEPRDASTPAESRDAQPRNVAAVRRGPRRGGVEIGHDLRVGNARHDLRKDVVALELRDVALAAEEVRRDREISELREAAAKILEIG